MGTRKLRAMATALLLGTLFVAGLPGISAAFVPTIAIYDGYPEQLAGSYPSLGFQATSTFEFGDHVSFAGNVRDLTTVEILLTNWACENDFSWNGSAWVADRTSTEACETTPGSSYEHPLTLNLYQVDNSGADPAVGALIASKTITATIYFRPSWDSVNCTAAGGTPDTDVPFGGRWYDTVTSTCVHGYNQTVIFDFSGDDITLPDEVIWGIAYNTNTYGAAPIGAPGPYESLNVAAAPFGPVVGTDVETDTTFLDSTWSGNYCDNGSGGTGTFRRDAGCWTGYTPVSRFTVETDTCDGFEALWLGTAGDDMLNGTDDDEAFVAYGGADTVYGNGGRDIICGGEGPDVLWGGDGSDRIFGGIGGDHIYGGKGNDRIYAQSGNDYVEGNTGNDRIYGGEGTDEILGGADDDFLKGKGGDDTIWGGPGNDIIYGQIGPDVLEGGDGDDVIYGGRHDDFLDGGGGTDILDGGTFDDTCVNGETVTYCEV